MKLIRMSAAVTALTIATVFLAACGNSAAPATKEIQTQRAQDFVIALLNEKGELAMGQNQFAVEFRSANSGQPVDVGMVTVGSSMSMPGMTPMTASLELAPGGSTGKYNVKGDFAMSGSWKFDVRWDGPAGRGATAFQANVR